MTCYDLYIEYRIVSSFCASSYKVGNFLNLAGAHEWMAVHDVPRTQMCFYHKNNTCDVKLSKEDEMTPLAVGILLLVVGAVMEVTAVCLHCRKTHQGDEPYELL